ncbi:endonuclease domain-containing protein [Aureivirga sp. CE67]|uniref:endonuclease domain-containing protein n=1 Tax=Aureivirga sp. CE67 TaxID=1788983 RepID=UPI0018C92365|nr:endonuclease domain-containing protein [Aureivirga sp. CE67]
MIYLKIFNKKGLIKHRKELRNNATPAESHLWKFLQKRKLSGYKFRRQHSIFNFIVDFYCPEKKLAIELDGAHHYTQEGIEKDKERDKTLKQLNIRTIRFENKIVLNNTEEVLDKILEELENNHLTPHFKKY